MNRYYTYLHIHPSTQEILYVGLGQNDRAWAFTSKARSHDHRDCLLELIELGFLPSDWVTIVGKCLSHTQAIEQERELIVQYQPRFNKDKHQRCMTVQQKKEALDLYLSGLSYKQVADRLGFHPHTVRFHIRKNV